MNRFLKLIFLSIFGFLLHSNLSFATSTIFVAEGSFFAVSSDGFVWKWDDQCKEGAKQVPDLQGITAIAAAGIHHPLLLDKNGNVWAWGDNGSGQLELGDTLNRNTPTQVPGLEGIQAIATANYHSLAVDSNGNVWAWGDNGSGQLGLGDTLNRNTPTQVPGLERIQAIATANYHSLAVDSNGNVWAWGDNGSGQLGLGDTLNRNTPTQVPGLEGIQAIATANYHSLAVDSNGNVWAWGDNGSGQLGLGDTLNRNTPTQVPGLEGIQAIATADYYSLAVDSNGNVWAWGDSGSGQLGLGDTLNRNTPTQVPGLERITAIATGSCHTLAVDQDGKLYRFGRYNHTVALVEATFKVLLPGAPSQVKFADSIRFVPGDDQHSEQTVQESSILGKKRPSAKEAFKKPQAKVQKLGTSLDSRVNAIIKAFESQDISTLVDILESISLDYREELEEFKARFMSDLVKLRAHDGLTALHIAAVHGRLEAVKVLKDTELLSLQTKSGLTALHIAAQYGPLEAVKVLKDTELLSLQTQSGLTALHIAALHGRLEAVKVLKDTELLSLQTKSGLTALHIAAQYGRLEAVKVLKDTILLPVRATRGWTALHIAAHCGHLEIVKVLKDTELLTFVTTEGFTALHLALFKQHFDVSLELLSENPKSVDTLSTTHVPLRSIGLATPKSNATPTILTNLKNLKRSAEIRRFIDLAESLEAFQKRNVEALFVHINARREIDLNLFSRDLDHTPYCNAKLNEFRRELMHKIVDIKSEDEVLKGKWECKKFLGLLLPEDANRTDCSHVVEQLEKIKGLLDIRLTGGLGNLCARALALGFSNMGKFYMNTYAEKQGATRENSFANLESYCWNARDFHTNLASVNPTMPPVDFCQIWKGISPADRLNCKTPAEFLQTVIDNNPELH
jgi:alpha-tubulin suppressor-like RCC1 family protein